MSVHIFSTSAVNATDMWLQSGGFLAPLQGRVRAPFGETSYEESMPFCYSVWGVVALCLGAIFGNLPGGLVGPHEDLKVERIRCERRIRTKNSRLEAGSAEAGRKEERMN